MKMSHQITLIEQQQHVLVPGIPLEVVFQILTPGAKRIPGIQHLHSKAVLLMQILPEFAVCASQPFLALLIGNYLTGKERGATTQGPVVSTHTWITTSEESTTLYSSPQMRLDWPLSKPFLRVPFFSPSNTSSTSSLSFSTYLNQAIIMGASINPTEEALGCSPCTGRQLLHKAGTEEGGTHVSLGTVMRGMPQQARVCLGREARPLARLLGAKGLRKGLRLDQAGARGPAGPPAFRVLQEGHGQLLLTQQHRICTVNLQGRGATLTCEEMPDHMTAVGQDQEFKQPDRPSSG